MTSETSGNLPSQHNSPHQAWVSVKIIEDRVTKCRTKHATSTRTVNESLCSSDYSVGVKSW